MAILSPSEQDTTCHYAAIDELPQNKKIALLDGIRTRRLCIIARVQTVRAKLAVKTDMPEKLKMQYQMLTDKFEKQLNTVNSGLDKLDAMYDKLCVLFLKVGD